MHPARTVLAALACLVVLAGAPPARAQQPAAGALPGQQTVPMAMTELRFYAEDPGLRLELVDNPEGVGLTTNLIPGWSSDEGRPVCLLPCGIRVPPGRYTFLAGDYEFQVEAMGETQEWYVEDSSTWMFLGGVTLTGLGIAGVVFGAIFLGVAFADEPTNDGMLQGGGAALGVGVPFTILGALLWAWSYGSAEQLQQPQEETTDGHG